VDEVLPKISVARPRVRQDDSAKARFQIFFFSRARFVAAFAPTSASALRLCRQKLERRLLDDEALDRVTMRNVDWARVPIAWKKQDSSF